MELEAKLKLEVIQDSDNLCEELSNEDLKVIGSDVVQTYEIDEQSRRKWMVKMKDATDLALQLVTPKSYPWPNAANVKFPLLTIASLQFASRAYPSLVKAPDLVKYRVQGKDEGGSKAARAGRISAHMSWQLLEQDENWEEDQDKAFLALPILGCVFKKSSYDPVLEHNKSTLVLPKNLCVHYYAKSIEQAERKTEIFELYNREIKERELRGVFKDNEYGPNPAPEVKDEDERQGMAAPLNDSETPRVFLEQHRYLDLDGDGYKEPYIVTVDKATKLVARIVARIDKVVTEQAIKISELRTKQRKLAEGLQPPQEGQPPQPGQLEQMRAAEQTLQGWQEEIEVLSKETPKILRIKPIEHYTKYSFIPSPDGGFYDLGFGALLGPINASVNTILNQLIDSGTMQNGSMGWIGKGARVKGGKLRFSPFEWKKVDVPGGQLRDNIVPLPVNAPSSVLFELLGLLITYAERIGSVTDAMMGDNPGQNTPAYNMSAMLEQGLQVFNGIFKRTYRSFRGEIRKLYHLNARYLNEEEYFAYQDVDAEIARADYTADVKDLIPAADPNAFSSKEKLAKAAAIRESAQQVAGYDPIAVELQYLEAMDTPNIPEIYPIVQGEDGSRQLKYPPQPDPDLEIQKADMQRRTLEGQSRAEKEMVLAESKVNVDEATIIKLMADAAQSADAPQLERLKLLAKDQESLRAALLEAKKIDEQAKAAAAKPTAD